MPTALHSLACGAAAALAAAAPPAGAEVVDRVAAVVGGEAIALSEIDAAVRLEALFNRAEPDAGASPASEVLARLIDRRLVVQDLALTPFLLPDPDEVSAQLRQLREERFLGGLDFEAALHRYGLTETDCRAFLAERIGFERYVSFRFKAGLDADGEAVRAFYEGEYAAVQREAGAAVEPFEAVADAIEQILIERRATELVEERLKELRASQRIEILAFAPDGAGP